MDADDASVARPMDEKPEKVPWTYPYPLEQRKMEIRPRSSSRRAPPSEPTVRTNILSTFGGDRVPIPFEHLDDHILSHFT